MTKIKNIEHLMELAQSEDGCECFVALNGGVRSSKQIWYDAESELWAVHHDIDDTDEEDISLMELSKNTNITQALKKGALFTHA